MSLQCTLPSCNTIQYFTIEHGNAMQCNGAYLNEVRVIEAFQLEYMLYASISTSIRDWSNKVIGLHQ